MNIAPGAGSLALPVACGNSEKSAAGMLVDFGLKIRTKTVTITVKCYGKDYYRAAADIYDKIRLC